MTQRPGRSKVLVLFPLLAALLLLGWSDVGGAETSSPAFTRGATSAQIGVPTPLPAPAPAASLPSAVLPGSTAPAYAALAACARCRELDDVWVKVKSVLRPVGPAASSVWHYGWVDYGGLYRPGVPAAAPGELCFPVVRDSFRENRRNFGSPRDNGNRCHAGVDIYTQGEGRVVAIDAGKVINIHSFVSDCSAGPGDALLVYHPNLVVNGVQGVTVNYGEMNRGQLAVQQGQQVERGQFLGVATTCSSQGSTMLHLEVYQGKVDHSKRWDQNLPGPVTNENQCRVDEAFWLVRPPELLDPTEFLEGLRFCEEGAVVSVGPNAYDAFILEASRAHGVEPAFIKAIIEHESGFDPQEISITGCAGLMQICQNSIDRNYIARTTGGCCNPEESEHEFRPCENEQKLCGNNLWCAAGGYLCSPDNDERFDPRLNILSGTATLKEKIDAVGSCGTDQVKAWIAAYNIGQNPIVRAVNANGGCERWEEVWQVLQRSTDVSANTIYGVHKKYDVGRRLDNLRGTPEDYVGKVYQSYLEYRLQLVG